MSATCPPAIGSLILALLAAGCGSSGPAPTTGSVRITNATGHPIDELYLTPTSAPSWGPLRNRAPLPVAGTLTVSDLPPGSYNALAVILGVESAYFAYAADFSVRAGATTTLVPRNQNFTGAFLVANGVSSPITEIYFVLADSTTWGLNLLTEVVPVSGAFVLSNVSAGIYDYQCVHQDGSRNTANAVQVASVATTTASCP